MKRGLIFLFAFLLSCDKDNMTGTPDHTKATIIDAGVDISDGCGWLIVLDEGGVYHPENLPAGAKHDKLDVWVNYTNTRDTFYCGIASTPYPVIRIIDIVPR